MKRFIVSVDQSLCFQFHCVHAVANFVLGGKVVIFKKTAETAANGAKLPPVAPIGAGRWRLVPYFVLHTGMASSFGGCMAQASDLNAARRLVSFLAKTARFVTTSNVRSCHKAQVVAAA